MSSKSYKAYYNRNREDITAKMRERNKIARDEKKREALKSQEGLDAWREENREKYYRARESKITAQLKIWLEDEYISDTFKKFLKECLWEHKGRLTKEFICILSDLSIIDAFKVSTIQPSERVDGNQPPSANQESEGEGEEEGDETEWEAKGGEAKGGESKRNNNPPRQLPGFI